MRKLIFCFLACLFLLALNSCSKSRVEKVRIGTIPWPGYGILHLTKEKGYFKKHGLDVEVKQYKNVDELHADYRRGVLDGLTGTLNEILEIREQTKQSPQVFWVADFSDGPDMLVAPKTVETVAELRGRKIGVDLGSVGIYVLARALDKAGMSLEDVRIVDTKFTDLVSLYNKGQLNGGVSAIVAYPPVTTQILDKGDSHALFTSKEIPGEVVDAVALEKEIIYGDRSFAESFVRALNEGVRHLRDKPDESIQFMVKTEKMPEDEFRDVLAGLKILDVCQQKEMFLPSGTLPEAVKTSDLVMRRVDQLSGPDKTVGMVTFGPVQVVGETCDI